MIKLRAPLLALLSALATLPAQELGPLVREADKRTALSVEQVRVPPDLRKSLWAAEPMFANPVAFCVDHQGRVFIAETFRLLHGVTDNRHHQRDDPTWLERDLACRTVADRVAMYREKMPEKLESWARYAERVTMLSDTDGDGRADRATRFAEGFNALPDGIAAGVLAWRGKVYFTCIPRLWLLVDADADGKAEQRQVLHEGYGVHTSLFGHDLHGLCMGPDGRLYFSIGDRGFHVVTPERTLSFPDEGAVLRCEPDGSGLEVVHRGLRNPQELAFDRYGNLFTGDNNADGGDKARWVYIVQGGHTGWHIGYQTLPKRGPWIEEGICEVQHQGQPAYIVPPLAYVASGPSGLSYDPGTGLPARYRDHFFLCDFRGGASNSGIRALKNIPRGAAFELVNDEEFVWRTLATDLDFAPDGSLLIADWVHGWQTTGRGRIFRVAPAVPDPRSAEVADLLGGGIGRSPVTRLLELLDHPDRRVRQEAQFCLVDAGAGAELRAATVRTEPQMRRLHALWGLGQLARKRPADAAVRQTLRSLLTDQDPELRAQAARLCGEVGARRARGQLRRLLADRSSRVRYFAAIALGALRDRDATERIVELIAGDAGRDAYLRHAGIMGLVGCASQAELCGLRSHERLDVRLAAVVALRKRGAAALHCFLDDEDPLVVLEAARAIHDEPLPAATTQLAQVLTRPQTRDLEPLLRRALYANVRQGDLPAARRVLRLATDQRVDGALRAEALRALATWADPSDLDGVINLYRPIPARDATALRPLMEPHIGDLLRADDDELVTGCLEMMIRHRVAGHRPRVLRLFEDERRGGALRRAALELLHERGDAGMVGFAARAAKDEDGVLRRYGLKLYTELAPAQAVPVLDAQVGKARIAERQDALAALGRLQIEPARESLRAWLQRLRQGKLDQRLQLELLEAAAQHKPLAKEIADLRATWQARAAQDPVAPWQDCFQGGDRRRGEKIFWEREDATACKRCHSVGKREGGKAGPPLEHIANRLDRRRLVLALVDPGHEVAPGFGTVALTLKNDEVVAGLLKEETADGYRLVDASGEEVVVAKAKVAEASEPMSAMPPMGALLERRELRDLVEYLASLKQREPKKKDH